MTWMESMFSIFFQGFVVGFSVAFPIGPISLLCFTNTLLYGFGAGVLAGLGASVGEAIYGALVGFCFSAVSLFFSYYGLYIHLFGVVFFGYLSWKLFKAAPRLASDKKTSRPSRFRLFSEPLLLLLTSPMTVILFGMLCNSVGLTNLSGQWGHGVIFVLGVFCGAFVWWLSLCFFVALVGKRLSLQQMNFVNTLSAIILLLFAFFSAWSVAKVVWQVQ